MVSDGVSWGGPEIKIFTQEIYWGSMFQKELVQMWRKQDRVGMKQNKDVVIVEV